MAIIGLDIGGTKLLGAVFNAQGQIIDKEKNSSKAEEGFDTVMKQIHKTIDSLVERNQIKIEGIGIGVPGTVNQDGYVVFTPNLPLGDYDLAKDLSTRYGVPVRVGNDVNLGTYGEYMELGITHKNVIGLFPGTGLGGGIIINRNLYIGQGTAGELGHIVVQKDGVDCNCGNRGCLESYASKKGIIKYIQNQLKKKRECELSEDVLNGMIKSSKLKRAFDNNDEVVVEAMDQFKEYLGLGIGIIINIFNPDLIIIGGGIIDAFGPKLLDGIRKHATGYALPYLFDKTDVLSSRLGDDAVIFGGYHLIKSS